MKCGIYVTILFVVVVGAIGIPTHKGSEEGRREQGIHHPWQWIMEIAKNDQDYKMDYPALTEEEGIDNYDYNESEDRPTAQKRSSVSPFISLGALNNLSQFFEQLRGTMDQLEQQQIQQTQMQAAAAAESDRAFRPPATAAVLHAFRNYRPLRRTRSFPPALVQG